MPTPRTLARVFLSAALLLTAAPASAQQPPSELRGGVMLEGAGGGRVPLADALVEVYCVSESSGRLRSGYAVAVPVSFQKKSSCVNHTARTNGDGRFAVRVGYNQHKFIIAVSAPGATPRVVTNVTLEGGRSEVVLRPGDGRRLPEADARSIARGDMPQPGEESEAEKEAKRLSGQIDELGAVSEEARKDKRAAIGAGLGEIINSIAGGGRGRR